MASKKSKGQKMDLGTFLTDSTLGSWADEMEDYSIPAPAGRTGYGGDRSYSSGGGFGSGGFSDRGYQSSREQLPLPTKPPFTVHLGNMPFDATNGDVEDFFSGCDVSNVRIVEDKLDQKPKGFAYVEFKTLDGIKKALELNGTQFLGRNIRISVAEPQKERFESRDFSDWSRKGPLPDISSNRRGPDRGGFNSSGPPRGFDNASDVGSERGNRRGGGGGGAYESSDGKTRDFGNWDRKGPLTPVAPAAGPPPPSRSFDRPGSRDGPMLRRNSPSWGEGKSQDGSRPPRREFTERPVVERVPTAAEQDNQWRARMKPDAPATTATATPPAGRSPALSNRELSNPPSPAAAAPAPPATRPKLNLAKRTVSENLPDSTATSGSDSKASPFGAAKPIDTAAREKEVEEKRQIAIREKKEADEKARTERRAAEEKAREEKRLAVAKEPEDISQQTQSPRDKSNGPKSDRLDKREKQEKENGTTAPSQGKQYEILRRHAADDASTADEEAADEADEANQNGFIIGDKEVKPNPPIRDIPATNGNTPPKSEEGPTAPALEDDGWSTVPEKRRKNGNAAARAIAS